MDSDSQPISILVAGNYPLNDRFLKMLRYYAETCVDDLIITSEVRSPAAGFDFTEITFDDLVTPESFDVDDRPSSASPNLPGHNWNYLKLRKGKY